VIKARWTYLLKWSAIVLPITLIVLLVAGWHWLFSSHAGSSWLWGQLENATDGQLVAEKLEGDLADGLVIHGVNFDSGQQEIQIRQIELQATTGIWPFSIEVGKLVVSDASVTQKRTRIDTATDAEVVDVRQLIEMLNLPVPVRFETIRIERLLVKDDSGESLFRLESAVSSLKLEDVLEISELRVETEMVRLSAAASLSLDQPFNVDLHIDTELNTGKLLDGGSGRVPLQLAVDGDLDSLSLELKSDSSGFLLVADIDSFLDDPDWDATGQMQSLPPGLDLNGTGIGIRDLRLTMQGNMAEWMAMIQSGVTIPGQPDTRVEINARSVDSVIHIEQARISGEGIKIEASGEFEPLHNGKLSLQTRIQQLSPAFWVADWPQDEYLSGELSVLFEEGKLQVPVGRIQVAGTDAEVRVDAEVDTVEGQLLAAMNWQNLRWPINAASPQVLSPEGQMELRGSMAQWTAAGRGVLNLGDHPPATLQLDGMGDNYSARLVLQDGTLLGGRFKGQAEVDWSTTDSWSLTLDAQGVDPEPILAGWPGRLDAKLSAAGSTAQSRVDVEIEDLNGRLRGQPIQARGGLSLEGDRLSFRQVSMDTGEARLQLDGSTADTTGVAFSFNGQLPGVLLAGASGYIALEGRFSGDAKYPDLQLSMEALDLAWKDMKVKAMSVQVSDEQRDSPVPVMDVNVTQLQWQDRLIDELSLRLQPGMDNNMLTARVASELVDLESRVNFKPEDLRDMWNSRWSGELEMLNLIIAGNFGFELDKPAEFAWTPGGFSMPSICVAGAKGGDMCAGVSYQVEGDLAVMASMDAVPLKYLQEALQLDVGFEQELSGQLDWRMPQGKAPVGNLVMSLSPGQVVSLVDNEPLMESREGRLSFKMQEGNLDAGMLDIVFPGIGFIDFDFAVMDFSLDGEQRLQGRLASQLSDIELFGQLMLPMLDDVGGRLESDIQLGGTITDPQFEGSFSLSDGLFYYAPAGVNLLDVNLSGQLESRDQGSLNGQFRLGDGIASVDGQFRYDKPGQVNLTLNLSGEDLLLINTTNLKMLTNADLRFGLAAGRLDIQGDIEVPSAQLSSSNLVINTVTDSEDLVIVNRAEQTETDTSGKENMQVFGNLAVSFGDDVSIKIPGVDAAISGSVSYDWTGDAIPEANGNYYLQGVVDIYGPRLEFTNSSIAFPGVPANNPLMNIRVQREIFGNTQIRSAGVQLTGTLKRPVLEAFTVPVTNEDRAWTLLLTGTDFDQGQGVGGFDVGTYILPRLYVSYGVSLFEDENVISARYDIKSGFGVKVTSGQRETGLDISYTIDK
jgi:translocation and assembly module TamB